MCQSWMIQVHRNMRFSNALTLRKAVQLPLLACEVASDMVRLARYCHETGSDTEAFDRPLLVYEVQ